MNKVKFFLYCLFGLLLCLSCKNKTEQDNTPSEQSILENKLPTGVKEIDSEEFISKVLDIKSQKKGEPLRFKGDKPMIVDFSAVWCAPCQKQAPILEKIAQEYKNDICVYKVDVDKSKDVANFFGIRSIPLLLFVPKEGEFFFYTGLTSMEEIQQAVENMMSIEKKDTISAK